MFGECTCASMLFLLPARTKHKIWDWIKEKPDSDCKTSAQNSQTYMWFQLIELNSLHSLLSLNFHIKVDSEVMDVLLTQCRNPFTVYVSNYHVLHLKYLTVLFVICHFNKADKQGGEHIWNFKKEANWEKNKTKQ